MADGDVSKPIVIKKLKKKFGVDQEKALQMLIMPDPSLSPEKQMEMISGGKVGINEGDKAISAPAPADAAAGVPGAAAAPTKEDKAARQVINEAGTKGVSGTSGL